MDRGVDLRRRGGSQQRTVMKRCRRQINKLVSHVVIGQSKLKSDQRSEGEQGTSHERWEWSMWKFHPLRWAWLEFTARLADERAGLRNSCDSHGVNEARERTLLLKEQVWQFRTHNFLSVSPSTYCFFTSPPPPR